jgi:F-type H+-transporting ATPase subunit a
MPEQLWLTELCNRVLGGAAASLLHLAGIAPRNPQAPITNGVALELLIVVLLVLTFLLVRSRLSVDRPGALQHLFEGAEGFVGQQAHEMIGHGSERFVSFLTALGFFILSCNLIGLIPGFESPTAEPAVPLGCALVAWFYYQTQGFRHAGPKYLLHFLGPVWWLAWLMLPIELISHLARMMSLTIRLFANMFAGDMVTLVFFSLVPLGVPVIFLGLHIGVSFLQTYIFLLLTMVYLAGAVAEEH